MKIKVLTIVGVFAMVFLAVGCGKTSMMGYTYKRAIIKWPDGEVKVVEISSYWPSTRYINFIEIKDKEGNCYLTDLKNVLLISY